MGSTDYHERRIATKGVERPFVVAEIQTGADIPRRLACQGSSLVWSVCQTGNILRRKSAAIAAEVRQEIQFDEEGRSLFTPGDLALFVEENKNSDLCVSDCQARIVLVMDRCGDVRTRYGGGHVGDKFNPSCLATDSSCRVLVTDTGNDLIHILPRMDCFWVFWGVCRG
ncbi:uncharacterized protein LOC111107876 [Crassostrea virginica]